ncbi:hypothetical protein GCM10009828_054890 [Actinoplanes couchii]|uniref:Uncharacterized protein n=1 Tax=Actinoplanes couchii TaxID=403638 RepID=A0ABQ3X0Q8_9ACTN|nr:hypothetical protein Aco03nite_005060 [Actinoplanes couchii]
MLVLTLCARPEAAMAGVLKSTAQGIRAEVNLLSGVLPLTVAVPSPERSWTEGGAASSSTLANPGLKLLGQSILSSGVVTSTAGPGTGSSGRAESSVAGASVLGATGIGVGAVRTVCVMASSGITTTTEIADLKVAGQTIANPDVNLKLPVGNLASVYIDHRTADWDANGVYKYTVRAVDVSLLGGAGILSTVANGSVVVAESVCSGTIVLDQPTVTPVALAPGQSGTPVVTATNSGDVGAQNTTIKIPKPGSQYVLGPPVTTGGGTCSTTDPDYVICTGVTVPGRGNAKVSLPVTLKSSAGAGTPAWATSTGKLISAASTPVVQADRTKTQTANGTLVNPQVPASTGGTVTVNQVTLAAGRTATGTVKVTNPGPSDAAATITVPIGNRPTGVTVASADVDGTPCTVTTATITCTAVPITAGAEATVKINTAATVTTPVGTTWDLAGVTALMNGTTVTGAGRLITVGAAEVNLSGGVTVVPATAIPGGSAGTATVKVTNAGSLAASPTTITIPAAPAGITVSAPVTTTGGGTCATGLTGVTCTGVTVPAGQSVNVAVPVTLAPAVTTPWVATSVAPITATAGGSTGTTTGSIVTPAPKFNLGVTATGPLAGTVSPGQTTTITTKIENSGPSDATPATFTVVAPTGTTLGTATGATCTSSLTRTELACSANLPAAAPALTVAVPVTVNPLADPTRALTGGCVSLDGDAVCQTGEPVLPPITLRTPFLVRVTGTFAPAVITPGQDGTGKLTLRSLQNESNLTVTIPAGPALPSGFSVVSATAGGTPCTVGATAVTCTGVDLTALTGKDVAVKVAVDQGVLPPAAWIPAGITVGSGTESTSLTGPLAATGTVNYTLAATATVPADNTVLPGAATTLGATVTNNGPSTAAPAIFRILAPNGTAFAATGLPAGCLRLLLDNVLTCTVASMARNASTGPLSLPITVAANTDPWTPVTGGCVDVDGIPGCGGSGDRPFPDFALKAPFSSRVAATTDRADVVPGRTGTATVHVKALHGDLAGLSVSVPEAGLPTGLTVTGVSSPSGGTCARDNSAVWTCTGLAVADGATLDVDVALKAAANATPGGTWTPNPVTVSLGADQITLVPQLARIAAAQPGLDATVNLSGVSPLPGGGGTLAVSLTNTAGPSDAVAVPVSVIAPAGTLLSAVTGTAAPDCGLALLGTRIDCKVSLPAGGAPVTIGAQVGIGTDVLSGRALTGGCVDLDGNSVCNSADRIIPGINVGTPMQQRIDVVTTPAKLVPGEDANAVLKVTSTGTENNLSVTVPTAGLLPTGANLIAATPVGGGTCDTNTEPVRCTGLSVTAGTPAVVNLQVASSPSGTPGIWTAAPILVTGGGEIAVDAGDLALVGLPRSDLSAVVSVPAAGSVPAGGTAPLAVTVTNNGPSDARPAVFTVSAPLGTKIDLTATPPSGCALSVAGLLATCAIPLADGADTGPISLGVKVPALADPFTALTGGCVDLDGVPGCGAKDQTVPAIDLTVPFARTLSLNTTPATIVPGTDGIATVALNADKGILNDVAVSVPALGLPAGLTIDHLDVNGTTCPAAACTGITVNPGVPVQVGVHLDAGPAAVPGTVWTAPGISVGNGDGLLTLDRKLAVIGPADIDIDPVITLPAVAVEPGRTGSLGVTIGNSGTSDATGISLGVIPPVGAVFTAPPPGCAFVVNTDKLSCTLNVPALGPDPVLPLTLKIADSAVPGSTLTGGCVDLNNDSVCLDPPDTLLGPVSVATPFDRLASIKLDTPVIPAGTAGLAKVLVDAPGAPGNPVTVTVPLDTKPAAMTILGETIAPNGNCATTAAAITCTTTYAGAGTATLALPITVAPGADAVWNATGITVTRDAGETVTGGGILARTSSPLYTLGAAVTLPADDSVLPGAVTAIKATIDNTGSGTATAVPIVLTAPTGTAFTTPLPDGCLKLTAVATGCAVTVDAGRSTTLDLPLAVPPQLSGTVSGGCVILGGGGCDVNYGSFSLRTPLASVITAAGGVPATVTPGLSDTATIRLDATAARNDLTVTVGTDNRPAGLSISAAGIGGNPCDITTDTVTCTGVGITGGGSSTLNLTVDATPDAKPGDTWRPVVRVSTGGTVPETALLQRLAATVGAADTGSGLDVSVLPPADGTVLPGADTVLRLVMTNPGPSVLPGATAWVKAPDGTTFGDLIDPAATYCDKASSTLVTCTADLSAETRRLRLPLHVPAPTLPGAVISGGCLDGDRNGTCGDSRDTALASFTLGKPFSAQARLGVAPGSAVTPGDIGSTVLRATTDRALNGMSVEIPLTALPPEIKVVDAKGPDGSVCTLTGAIVCTGVNLPQATTDLVTVKVKPLPSAAEGIGWALTPAAPVTLTSSAGDVAEFTGTLLRTGPAVPGLKFAPSLPPVTVTPGTTAAFRAVITNTGPSDAVNRLVRVNAPAGTTFGTPVPAGCAAVGTGALDCRATLAVNAPALTWELPVRIPANADPNTAVTGGCLVDGRSSACGAGTTPLPPVTLTPALSQALTISALDPPEIKPGRTGTLTVRIAASRARTGLGVTIPLTSLPVGMSIVRAQAGGRICVVGVTAVTCLGLDVSAGGTLEITLNAVLRDTAEPGTTWIPTVSVVEGAQNAARTLLAATVGAADTTLGVAVEVPAAQTLRPGDAADLTATVTNTGSSAARGLPYTFFAPAGTTFRAPAAATGATCAMSQSGLRVDCSVDVSGNARTRFPLPITVSGAADVGTPLTGGCADTDRSGACTAADVAIPPIQLRQPLADRLQITGGPATVVPGGSGTGTVRITSLMPVTGAALTVPLTGLPTGFTVTGASGPDGSACDRDAVRIQCTGVALASGTNTAMSITVQLAPGVETGASWAPAGVTFGLGTESLTGVARLIEAGTRTAKVVWSVLGAGGTAAPGATRTLTVTGANQGPSSATGATVAVVAPSGTTFGTLAGNAARDCKADGAELLTCTAGLEPDTSLSWEVPLTVGAGATDGQKLDGGCVSTDGDTGCGGAGDTAIDPITVVAEPQVSLRDSGTVGVTGAVVPPGGSGTAAVTFSATGDFTGLTLTVPLAGRPAGVTVDSATLDGATCDVGADAVTCTGIDLTAGVERVLKLGVTVSGDADWQATGITLADPATEDDILTVTAKLVSTGTTGTGPDVTVTTGAWSPETPARGQTATLPITLSNAGTEAADPYRMTVVLPTGLTHGTLPSECAAGDSARIVTCEVPVPAGDAVTLDLPAVVGASVTEGGVLTGGCLGPETDTICGGTGDLALPDLTVGRHDVDLEISYAGGTVTAPAGGNVVVTLPYTNRGSRTAAQVALSIVPPVGVTVAGVSLSTGVSAQGVRAAAAVADVVKASCKADTTLAANAVVCGAPDASADSISDVSITLKVGAGAQNGLRQMAVTVSTTDVDGFIQDNSVRVPLMVSGTSNDGDGDGDGDGDNGGDDGDDSGDGDNGGGDDGGDGDLPTTGAQVTGLVLLSAMLMAGGVGIIAVVRENAPVPAPARHRAGRHRA